MLAPDPCTDEDGFVELLASLGDALGRPAPIFPTHDEGLNAVARGQAELGERFRVGPRADHPLLPRAELVEPEPLGE